MPKLIVRDMTEQDLPLQDAYFENAPDEQLLRMGVNAALIRGRKSDPAILRERMKTPLRERLVHAFAYDLDGRMIGTMALKQIKYGESCDAHGHIFDPSLRQMSLGTQGLVQGFALAFEMFKVKLIFCEPSVGNRAPNALLQSLGLKIKDTYDTPAGGILLARTANRYEIERDWFVKELRPRYL